MTLEELHENEIYRTTDLSCAAAIALWFPPESIDRSNPSKAEFIFLRNQQLNQLLESFWKGELQVEATSYFNSIKLLKNRIMSG